MASDIQETSASSLQKQPIGHGIHLETKQLPLMWFNSLGNNTEGGFLLLRLGYLYQYERWQIHTGLSTAVGNDSLGKFQIRTAQGEHLSSSAPVEVTLKGPNLFIQSTYEGSFSAKTGWMVGASTDRLTLVQRQFRVVNSGTTNIRLQTEGSTEITAFSFNGIAGAFYQSSPHLRFGTRLDSHLAQTFSFSGNNNPQLNQHDITAFKKVRVQERPVLSAFVQWKF